MTTTAASPGPPPAPILPPAAAAARTGQQQNTPRAPGEDGEAQSDEQQAFHWNTAAPEFIPTVLGDGSDNGPDLDFTAPCSQPTPPPPRSQSQCPICAHPWQQVRRTWSLGRKEEKCHGCHTIITHGKGIRRCTGQPSHMRCAACATKTRGATATEPTPSPTRDPEPPIIAAPYSLPSDHDKLLSLLQQLPTVWHAQPMHWVPRALRSMAGQALLHLLDGATTALAAEPGDTRALATTLLCRNAGMLLLRPPAREPNDESTPTTATPVIRKRLLLATSGDWETLVQDALDEIAAAKLLPPPAQREPQFPLPHAPLPDDLLSRAASKARTGGVRSAANILTGGAAVPPSPATTAKIRDLFHTSPPSVPAPPPTQELVDLIESTRHLPAKTIPTIRPRHASTVASHLSGPAGPGPSGYRNTFIQLIASQPQGPRALSQWAQAWASGSVQSWLAPLWTHQLCRPFFKSDGVDIRPVMCGEALYKFASSCTIFVISRSLTAAMGDHQYGAGRSGGAALELAHVQAEVSAQPDHALVSLDIKNAFGAILWATALRITIKRCPRLARFLTCAWQAGYQRLWVQTPDPHDWDFIDAVGSLIQGGPEAHQIFCLVMADILEQADRDSRWHRLTWAYVDDITLLILLDHLCDMLTLISDALRAHNCELQPKKCHICVPALHDTDEPDWPVSVLTAATMGYQVNHSSIPLLGSDAAAAHAMTLYTDANGAVPTIAATSERARKALTLLDACDQLAASNAPAGGRWPALCIARDIACRALSYDSRVLPRSLVLPHARSLDEASMRVLSTIFGHELTAAQQTQFYLPAHLGGLSWPHLQDETTLSRLACILETGPALHAALRRTRPDATTDDIRKLDHADTDATLLDDAAALGIRPGPCGLPSEELGKDPLHPPAPARHLLSAYLQTAGQHRFATLWPQLDTSARTRLLSCGGIVAGQSLTAPPTTDGINFHDAEYRLLLKWRFGTPWLKGQCRNEPRDGGNRCNHDIDTDGGHCLACMMGPARYSLHHAACEQLCGFCAEAGAVPRREVFVPEFAASRTKHTATDDDERRKAAFLDVWAFGTAEVSDLLADVTFRHAGAERYQPLASQRPGAAARKAAEEKQARYPARGGRKVVTFGLESWGRLGAEGEALLLALRAAADNRDRRTGHCQPGRLLRWRRQLDATVQRGIAKCLQSSLYGLPGRPASRSQPGTSPAGSATF